MGFKLVRIEATERRYEVSLPLGSHFLGRGKFLDCNDNRVSRNHAELIVTKDSVLLKSLHKNPCFLKKKSSGATIIFSYPDSQVLSKGDRFGLIPDNFWYEVIVSIEDSTTDPTGSKHVKDEHENENPINHGNAKGDKGSDTQTYNQEDEENRRDCSQSLLDAIVNSPFHLPQKNQALPASNPENVSENPHKDNPEDMDTTSTELAESTNQPVESTNQPVESTNQPVESTNQPVDTTNQPLESTNQPLESTNQPLESTNQPLESTNHPLESTNYPIGSTNSPDEPSDQPIETTRPETPTKRLHSEENSPCDVKRVKMEPEYRNSNDEAKPQPYTPQSTDAHQAVKTEPTSPRDVKPGPSNDQGGPSSKGDGNPPAMPPSPTKPPNKQLRERCMYGASCYRRNPLHIAQFSHPTDADWGSGERGTCPWGAACLRADPRHWRDHDHPPGVQPPQPRPRPRGNRPGMQLVRRRGNNFYINANSVHFYDDHFELEDSDGDSVDYDYEF